MVRPIRDDRDVARQALADAIDDVLRRALALGGSIEYVHGVGVKLAHLLAEELGEGLDLARRVKRAIDPVGTMNPGKAGV
jgi:FAD/FMN-containing dehydrogenase